MQELEADTLTLRLTLAEARAIDSALSGWMPPSDRPPSDPELERFVQWGLHLRDNLEASYVEEFRRAVARERYAQEDLQRGRRVLALCTEIGIRGLRRMAEVVEMMVQAAGAPGTGASRLREAVSGLQALEKRLADEWPVLGAEEEKEAKNAIARGEGQNLDEAFAEMAGVAREEWLARVERRRQELQSFRL